MKVTRWLLLTILIAIAENSLFANSLSVINSDSLTAVKSVFKPFGKPVIQVFGNFDFNASENSDKKYGFWFGRAHFGYEYHFSNHFYGKIILDAGRPTTLYDNIVTDSVGNVFNLSATGSEGSFYTMGLKFAFLEWKPLSWLKLQAGGILQNHYISQEKFWGYRYVAETFQDRYFRIPSGDLGLITYITVSKKTGFDFAVTNGEGFRSDQDAFGDVKVAAGFDYRPVNKLTTRLYFDFNNSSNPLKPTIQQMLSFFAGYRFSEKFRLAAEYNQRFNHRFIDDNDLHGYSFYGSILITGKTELFVRHDRFIRNPSADNRITSIELNSGNAFITGIHLNPVNGINVSLNYQYWLPDASESVELHHILLSFEYHL